VTGNPPTRSREGTGASPAAVDQAGDRGSMRRPAPHRLTLWAIEKVELQRLAGSQGRSDGRCEGPCEGFCEWFERVVSHLLRVVSARQDSRNERTEAVERLHDELQPRSGISSPPRTGNELQLLLPGSMTTRSPAADRVGAHDGVMYRLDQLLTVRELAIYLDVPVATLYAWRHRRQGPPGFKAGRHLRYRLGDVESWIAQQLQETGTLSQR